MLVFAVGVVLVAYASVGLGLNGKLPAGLVDYGAAFAGSWSPRTSRSGGSRHGRTRCCCRSRRCSTASAS